MINNTISAISLANFRNYNSAQAFLSNSCLIYGANGSGKSNFIEAISLFTTGKGTKKAHLVDQINRDIKSDFKVSITIKNGHGSNQAEIISNISEGKKYYFLDKEAIPSASPLTNYIKPIWLTPQMSNFFLENNTVQRKFFDKMIGDFFHNHLNRMYSYQKSITERNLLLRQSNPNHQWLNSIEEIISQKGVSLIATRLEFLDKLNKVLEEEKNYLADISITTTGELESLLTHNSALITENIFKETLLQNRTKDKISGITSVGPHKSNFMVMLNKSNQPARLCSTGEQKLILITIIIALTKLIRYEHKLNTVLLLDELLTHLDAKTSDYTLSYIINSNHQCIITSVGLTRFEHWKKQLQILKIENNTIIT